MKIFSIIVVRPQQRGQNGNGVLRASPASKPFTVCCLLVDIISPLGGVHNDYTYVLLNLNESMIVDINGGGYP